MECFVAIHYTAKAFYVLGISIWGLGQQFYQSKLRFLSNQFLSWRVHISVPRLSDLALAYCAYGKSPPYSLCFSSIKSTILLKPPKKWTRFPTMLATAVQVRQTSSRFNLRFALLHLCPVPGGRAVPPSLTTACSPFHPQAYANSSGDQTQPLQQPVGDADGDGYRDCRAQQKDPRHLDETERNPGLDDQSAYLRHVDQLSHRHCGHDEAG